MGKNVALAALVFVLVGIGIWALTAKDKGPGDGAASIVHGADAGVASPDGRSSNMNLAEAPDPLTLPSGNVAQGSRAEVEVIPQIPQFVDLDVVVTNSIGKPIRGTKFRVHLANNKTLTRWTSDLGEFSLYGIPTGDFSVSSPGYRVAFPEVDEPIQITGEDTVQVQVSGQHVVRGTIFSDRIDKGEIRLYKTIKVEQVSPRHEVSEQAALDKQAEKDLLLERLRGRTPNPINGYIPVDARTFLGTPKGTRISYLREQTFTGQFEFAGLDPGHYHLVVQSENHTKRAKSFEVVDKYTEVQLDISDGFQILVAVQYGSGAVPRSSLVRLFDQFATDKPRRVIESAEDTDTGVWTFRDLEAGSWFVEVRPGPRSIGRQIQIAVPERFEGVPVLDLILEEPRETTLKVKFQAAGPIDVHNQDRLIAVFRQPTGEYLGTRHLNSSSLKPLEEGKPVDLGVGLLFPGDYDVFLYPDPIWSGFPGDWVGPFEAKRARISVPIGTGATSVDINLDWYRSADEKQRKPVPGFIFSD